MDLSQNLSSQTVLVTGASRGIGAATTGILLKAGARVIGSFNREPGALAALLDQYGADRLHICQADLSIPLAAARLWDRAIEFAGKIDGLVNNAGIMPETPLNADDARWAADWASVMQVNIQSVADLCRSAILHFQKAGSGESEGSAGRIVNVASRAAFRGDGPDYMHYAASKSALVGLTRTIARAYASDRIFAYIVAPGWVRTDMASVAYEPGNEHMLEEIPMGKAAEPEDVGNMIAFLISGLADHATGGTFDINGASYVR